MATTSPGKLLPVLKKPDARLAKSGSQELRIYSRIPHKVDHMVSQCTNK